MNSNGRRVNESAINRFPLEREILCVPHGRCWSRSILSDLFLPATAFVLVLVCPVVSVHVRTLMKTCPQMEDDFQSTGVSFRFSGRFDPHYARDSYKSIRFPGAFTSNSLAVLGKSPAHFGNNILNQQKAANPTAKGGRRRNKIVCSP
jgi:hypothetical protein